MSLITKLENLINSRGYVSYGEICQFTAEEGYKISTGERRLRDLKEDGKVETEIKKSKRNTDYISGYYATGKKPERELVGYITNPLGEKVAVYK